MRRKTNKSSNSMQDQPKIQDAAGHTVRNTDRERRPRNQEEHSPQRPIYMDRNIYRMNDLYERGSI